MRLPWKKAKPAAPAVFYARWAFNACIHAQVISSLVQRFAGDERLADAMRADALTEARKLVAVLQGDMPQATGNVLRFARKA